MGELNKLLTHACTFDLVPLVFEKSCFAGYKFEYKWKTKQNAQTWKRNVDSTSKNQAKAHFNKESGPSTDVGRVQAHLGTDHMKAVTGQPHQGADAPGVWPHPCCCLLGLVSSGGYMPPCYVGPWWFPKIPAPNRPWISINRRVELTFNTHNIWSYTSLPYLLLLLS